MKTAHRHAISRGKRPVTIQPKTWGDLGALSDLSTKLDRLLVFQDDDDLLTADEFYVLEEIVYEGTTIREIAAARGLGRSKVVGIRDRATAKLIAALA